MIPRPFGTNTLKEIKAEKERWIEWLTSDPDEVRLNDARHYEECCEAIVFIEKMISDAETRKPKP